MRHHVQEKRRQRKHSHPRRDQDKIIGRSLRYFPWQQKTLDLEDEDFDFNAPIGPRESPERTESVPDDKSLVREKHPSRRLIDPCLCNRQFHGKRHQPVFLRLTSRLSLILVRRSPPGSQCSSPLPSPPMTHALSHPSVYLMPPGKIPSTAILCSALRPNWNWPTIGLIG